MGVLHIVHRVLIRGAGCQLQVKIEVGVWLPQVKEEAGRVNGHFLQQGIQSNGLAGTLRQLNGLAVPHQAHHLHNHTIQTVRVQPQGGERRLHPRHIAMVIRTQHIHGLIIAAGHQLIIMISNIRHNISGNAVGTHQHNVLVVAECTGLEPQGAVLLIGNALFFQCVNHPLHRAVPMEGRLLEPAVILNAVCAQVPLQPGNVLRQSVIHQRLAPLLCGRIHIPVAVFLDEILGVLHNIHALVGVLRQLHRRVIMLQIAHFQGSGELLNLIAGVVHIKLPLHIISGPIQHRCQAVADRAAPGVADMHRPGGIGRDELHQHTLALAVIRAAVILALRHQILQHSGIKPVAQEEIDKAGTGDLCPVKHSVCQIQSIHNGLGDHPGRLVECLGTGHGHIGGVVAVLALLGHFDNKGRQGCLVQHTVRHGTTQSVHNFLF